MKKAEKKGYMPPVAEAFMIQPVNCIAQSGPDPTDLTDDPGGLPGLIDDGSVLTW